MSAACSDSVKERVFVVKFDNIEQARLLEHFDSFQKFCLEKKLKYERKVQWHAEIDTNQDIPQIKEGSCQIVEHHFRYMLPEGSREEYGIFRIVPDGIIFNAVQSKISKYNSLDYMNEVFISIWNEYCKNMDLPEKCNVSLCYALHLNSETLKRDRSLFRPGWLEVKEISSLFKGVKDFKFKNQYKHPFSCFQNWSTNDDQLGEVSLSCKAGSCFIGKLLSLQFLLEVSNEKVKTQDIGTLNWNYLFSYLSQIRDVVLMEKALDATNEEWK